MAGNIIGGPYIARATTACCVNTNDTISNNAIDIIAIRVGHDWNISHFPKDIRDATGTVRGLSPASDSGHLVVIVGGGGGKTDGADPVTEAHGAGQLDDGKVIV